MAAVADQQPQEVRHASPPRRTPPPHLQVSDTIDMQRRLRRMPDSRKAHHIRRALTHVLPLLANTPD